MATLKELARRTGYSQATISRILRSDPTLSVTEQARLAVLQAAGEANYAQTRSARGRPRKNVMRLALCEGLSAARQLDDPYYLYLGEWVRRLCRREGYALIALEREGERICPPDGPVDGVVAVGVFDARDVAALAAVSANVVFLDSCPAPERFDGVTADHAMGVRLALEHLTAIGRRRLYFLGPERGRESAAVEPRWAAFGRLTGEMGLAGTRRVECPMRASGAEATWAELLAGPEPLPDGVLCANEEIAVGTLNALRRAGRAVPGEAAVVSFNDTPRSALLEPSLTSVSIPVETMAETALALARQRMARPVGAGRTVPLRVTVPLRLIVRESTNGGKTT